MTYKYILPIDTKTVSLELIGGKGKSLAAMASAGMSVPSGFYLTTTAYKDFVEKNNLQEDIINLAKPEIVGKTVSFESASKQIQDLIKGLELSDEIANEIRQAYKVLKGQNPAVAVRSSANAEDLPDLSFAGQQDTYLNVSGDEALITAIRDCWASLWTPRAISYRHQMGIQQDMVAMAVVVQLMVPSDVSGILFSANPVNGDRSEIIINSSFGLGEAVVGGQVTPDTYVVDRKTLTVKESIIGPKAQKIISSDKQGTILQDVSEHERNQSSLSEKLLKELTSLSLNIEQIFDGVPQDIEWAISSGKFWMLQSRPITNLPPQPIEVTWEPTPPAKILARRQIVENIPDPCSPLFDELYLTEGLESPAKGQKRKSFFVGGGPMFVTVNGYAYQRFDFPQVVDIQIEIDKAVTEEEKEDIIAKIWQQWDDTYAKMRDKSDSTMEQHDLDLFLAELSSEDLEKFNEWAKNADIKDIAHELTMPESKNPTYTAFNKTQVNENQIKGWREKAMPNLLATVEEWQKIDYKTTSDEELLKGIKELAIAGGRYWSSNASHTFGVAKSTDDQLQAFLRENLPDHNFISGHFLSGFKSKTLEANEHMFKIAKLIQKDNELYELMVITPSKHMMEALQNHPNSDPVVKAIEEYLEIYGHLGYSLDFVESLPTEDPSGLLSTLKTMITAKDYNPNKHQIGAAQKREEAMQKIEQLLDGLQYWQFRYRHWFTHRFYFIREEVMFYLTSGWPVLRLLAMELGQHLVDAGTINVPDDIFYLVTEELTNAVNARKENKAIPEYQQLTTERRELREARKRLHPPGTIPEVASNNPGVAFKETQAKNDPNSDILKGIPVSPGTVTSPASLIKSPAEFDQMQPDSILVCPMTNPAWTPLFAHATGLVTDMGGILGHGSIVAREYGIPAVVGTGNITQRVKHGQKITVDGDAGTVALIQDETKG
ncbi:MAG: PEP/pyruvate-binding domain-containing protein [Promethearchaeota archaeon]|jgi:pyruvate,water dikinase